MPAERNILSCGRACRLVQTQLHAEIARLNNAFSQASRLLISSVNLTPHTRHHSLILNCCKRSISSGMAGQGLRIKGSVIPCYMLLSLYLGVQAQSNSQLLQQQQPHRSSLADLGLTSLSLINHSRSTQQCTQKLKHTNKRTLLLHTPQPHTPTSPLPPISAPALEVLLTLHAITTVSTVATVRLVGTQRQADRSGHVQKPSHTHTHTHTYTHTHARARALTPTRTNTKARNTYHQPVRRTTLSQPKTTL